MTETPSGKGEEEEITIQREGLTTMDYMEQLSCSCFKSFEETENNLEAEAAYASLRQTDVATSSQPGQTSPPLRVGLLYNHHSSLSILPGKTRSKETGPTSVFSLFGW